jgi:hypothetical protein
MKGAVRCTRYDEPAPVKFTGRPAPTAGELLWLGSVVRVEEAS